MPSSLATFAQTLKGRTSLSDSEVDLAVAALADESVAAEEKAEFLKALHDKGETPEEIAAFARAFRSRASSPGDRVLDLASEAIDFVGTGGDKSGAFNISTTVSFILATAGVRVVKHGNRGATSKTGSADLLESLGIPLEADPDLLAAALEELNFCFLFARAYHPAFKAIVPVRAALAKEGIRTVFNLLGPLINPAKPSYQVMGVYSEHLVEPISLALTQLGIRRGMVVHGRMDGGRALDKFSTAGKSHVRGVGELEDLVTNYTADDLGLPPARWEDLQGSDAAGNIALLNAFLAGKANPGLTSTLYLNAGAGLWVMKKTKTLRDGIQLARELVEGGAVKNWVERTREFYRDHSDS